MTETGRRIGFITPLTHNFCESCNRVRLTCTGTLFMCLGQEDAADLRTPVRMSDDDGPLIDRIHEAIGRKPKGHDFIIDRRHTRPAVPPYERDRRLSRSRYSASTSSRRRALSTRLCLMASRLAATERTGHLG